LSEQAFITAVKEGGFAIIALYGFFTVNQLAAAIRGCPVKETKKDASPK